MVDKTTINQIQQANDIVELIAEHVSLKKKGREMVGLCPFHQDHQPSMYVNGVKQIFKCFACGAGGSVFTFVQMRENLTFPQAIERLAQRAGIKLKHTPAARTRQQTSDIDPNRLAKANAWAAEHFQKNLNDENKGASARDYIDQRQITSESAKKWQIGLAAGSGNDLSAAAEARRIPQQLLIGAGLIVGRTTDKFVNRLMFPITDVTGRVIAFGGRTLADDNAKYVNSPTTPLFDKSNSLYGLGHARHAIVSSGLAVVVEGYTDCIMAHQLGCTNVVAALGTSFTTGQARMLRRYAKKVVIVFDSDTAGIAAANRALEVCLSQRIDIKLATIPEGKDPCDFLLTAGKEKFEQLVENAVDVFEFKWTRLNETLSKDGALLDNKAAIEEYLQTIATGLHAQALPPIERGLLINRLAKIIGLNTKDLNNELAKRLRNLQRTAQHTETVRVENQKVSSSDSGKGIFAAAQREIIEVLLSCPKLFETVKEKTTPEAFDQPVLREIADILFETLSDNPDASLAQVLAKTQSTDTSRLIVELADAGEKKANFETRLTGALNAIKRHQLQTTRSRIKAVEDQDRFLRKVAENTEKHNPHNVGMV